MKENYIKILEAYFKSGYSKSIYYTDSILERLYSKGKDNIKALASLFDLGTISLKTIKISSLFDIDSILRHNVKASSISDYPDDCDESSIGDLLRNDESPIFIYTKLTDLVLNYLGLSPNGYNTPANQVDAFKMIRNYHFGINNFFICKIVEQFEKDVKSIYSVNPKAKIMAFEVDDSDEIAKRIIPKTSFSFGINQYDKTLVIKFISKLNEEIKKVCENDLSVYYMDKSTFGDCKEIMEKLSEKIGDAPKEPKKLYSLETDDNGLDGVFCDMREQYSASYYVTFKSSLSNRFIEIDSYLTLSNIKKRQKAK